MEEWKGANRLLAGRKMNRNMSVRNMEIRRAVQAGVDPDSPLLKRHLDPEVIKEIEAERSEFLKNGAPTTLQRALLERYNSDPKNAYANNIDELISNNIFKVRRAIQNMIDYGDARVFKYIPEEVKKEIELYGMAAQEHYELVLSNTTAGHVYVIPENYRMCCKCGKFRHPKYFYKSTSDAYNGRLPICSECISELFIEYLKKYKDIREVLILMSHKLDAYVYEPVLEKYTRWYEEQDGKEAVVNGGFFSKYYMDLLLQKHLNPDLKNFSFEHSKFEGVPFKCVTTYSIVPQIYNDRFASDDEADDFDDDDFAQDDKPLSDYATKRLKDKFGNYPPNDLRWLERRYREWENEYDITELNKKKLITQMCCDELTIVRGRERGEDVSKLWKTFMDTMKTSSLTPKQQDKNSTSNGFGSLSELISAAEKRGPIVERAKEFNDVDGVNRFIVAISGAIARTLGKKNEYTEAFEQIYEDYTSNVLTLDDNDDELEDSGDDDAEA